jgi:hypothetical protein
MRLQEISHYALISRRLWWVLLALFLIVLFRALVFGGVTPLLLVLPVMLLIVAVGYFGGVAVLVNLFGERIARKARLPIFLSEFVVFVYLFRELLRSQ